MNSRKLLIIIFFCIILSVFLPSIKAQLIIDEGDIDSVTIKASEDTYISQGDPSNPHNSGQFIVGDNTGTGENEAYFKFPLTELTDEMRNSLSHVNFKMYINSYNGTLDIELYQTFGSFDEASYRWNDGQLTRNKYLKQYTIDKTGFYTFELSSNIDYSGGQQYLTLMIVELGSSSNWCQGRTKDYSDPTVHPKIYWYYHDYTDITWEVVIIVAAIAAAITIAVIVRKRKGRGVGSKDDVSLRAYEDEPMVGGRYGSIKKKGAKASTAAQEKICLFCGLRNRSRTEYCKGCGNPLTS
jgi:hypothetical protein